MVRRSADPLLRAEKSIFHDRMGRATPTSGDALFRPQSPGHRDNDYGFRIARSLN